MKMTRTEVIEFLASRWTEDQDTRDLVQKFYDDQVEWLENESNADLERMATDWHGGDPVVEVTDDE